MQHAVFSLEVDVTKRCLTAVTSHKWSSLPVCVNQEVCVCGGGRQCLWKGAIYVEGVSSVKDNCSKSSEVNSKSWELPLRLAVVRDTEAHAAVCSLTLICCLFPATTPCPLSPVRAFVIYHRTLFPSLNDFAPHEKISHLQAVPTLLLLLLLLLYPAYRTVSAHSKPSMTFPFQTWVPFVIKLQCLSVCCQVSVGWLTQAFKLQFCRRRNGLTCSEPKTRGSLLFRFCFNAIIITCLCPSLFNCLNFIPFYRTMGYNAGVDCRKILCRHSWSSDNNFWRVKWSLGFSSSTTKKFIFVVLSEISQQLLDILSWLLVRAFITSQN